MTCGFLASGLCAMTFKKLLAHEARLPRAPNAPPCCGLPQDSTHHSGGQSGGITRRDASFTPSAGTAITCRNVLMTPPKGGFLSPAGGPLPGGPAGLKTGAADKNPPADKALAGFAAGLNLLGAADGDAR